MLTDEERKWIDENDVLDRYVFGQLNEEEAARFQFLIDKDPSFLDEVEFNSAIIAGIRQKGRLEMKQRIQWALKEEPTSAEMHLQTSARTPGARESMPFLLKIAAAVLLLIGASVIAYQVFFNKPAEAPMAEDEVIIKTKPAEVKSPKEEIKVPDVPEESKKVTVKKSTSKQKSEEKPMIAATPPENLMQKRNQKFRVETYMMPKPNEITVSLFKTESKTETETIVLFKNPTDLVAVNINETYAEDDGRLKWFFVVYENQILNAYLDNSKYLTLFKNAKLTETSTSLQIDIKDASFVVDLKSAEKFKKAVIKSQ